MKLGAVTGLAVAVIWLLYLLWRSPRRDDLSTYGAFALPVAAVVIGWVTRAWRKGRARQSGSAVSGKALDQVADQLAAAVHEQWTRAAEKSGLTGADPVTVTWGKPLRPMAGPPAAAARSRRFAPLPEVDPVGERELASGQAADLHRLYGGLPSGRLIIAGPPGSGKTGAAVLLLLAALRHREEVPAWQRARVPVPVLFTAQDWNPHHQLVADWVAGKLQGTYPLFTGTAGAAAAAALLATGRITVIIDGLDEISSDLRAIALQALSQQATFRLVVLSRTSEMAAAARHRQGLLQGAAAIELKPVNPSDAASYLERIQLDPAPQAWQQLIERIRTSPASPLCKALSNPLTITLVRDTYLGEDIRELLEFADSNLEGLTSAQAAEAITDHLLDRVLPAAYAHRPGQTPLPYDLATAQRTLTRIAALMSQEGIRDLNWWQIPHWARTRPRNLTAGFEFATPDILPVVVLATVQVVVGVVAVAAGVPDWARNWGGEVALAMVPVIIIVAGQVSGGIEVTPWRRSRTGALVMGTSQGRPRTLGAIRLNRILKAEYLTLGVAAMVTTGAVSWWYGVAAAAIIGVAAGAVAIVAGGLKEALAADPDDYETLYPTTSWRGSRNYGLVTGAMGGSTLGLMMGVMVGEPAGLASGVIAGVASGVVVGVATGLFNTVTWIASLAFKQMAIKWGTHPHLMMFLNDAYNRNVLRAVGPSYQFRHARVQDRLATAASTCNDNPARSSHPQQPGKRAMT